MNQPKRILLGVCFAFFGLQSQAQESTNYLKEPDYTKPQLFADLPLRMRVKIDDLSHYLKTETGSSVAIQLADGFLFEGTVISKSDTKDQSVESIVVRSTNRPGAVLTFSRINTGKEIIYRGRILSKNNSDSMDIKEENGSYSLVKKSLYDSLNE